MTISNLTIVLVTLTNTEDESSELFNYLLITPRGNPPKKQIDGPVCLQFPRV